MQSFKTHVLDDLRVQGKFNQDGLVIGRGISEQLVFETGYAEAGVITYDLSGCGYTSVNTTFHRRVDLDSTLNAGCDSFFGEKQVDRPSFALFHDGNKNCWCLEEFNGTSAGYVTPMYQTNETTLDENSTWKYNMGPSPAPTSVVKHEVPGKVAPAIRFTPGIQGERTFEVQGDTSHPVYDELATLRPYPKPVNDFTNMWVLAEEDTIWISDAFKDENFPTVHYIMYIGSVDGPSPGKWRIHDIATGDGDLGLDWNGSNTYYFLGAQENVTWSNGEATAYPASIDDWSTDGYLGTKPAVFSMSSVEGSAAKLELTNDGINWISVAGGGSGIEYEPITFTASELSSGKLTIQHNFGRSNILCLDSVPKPKEIEYGLNAVVLDFSDQAADVTGVVWFVGSEASMLTPPPNS